MSLTPEVYYADQPADANDTVPSASPAPAVTGLDRIEINSDESYMGQTNAADFTDKTVTRSGFPVTDAVRPTDVLNHPEFGTTDVKTAISLGWAKMEGDGLKVITSQDAPTSTKAEPEANPAVDFTGNDAKTWNAFEADTPAYLADRVVSEIVGGVEIDGEGGIIASDALVNDLAASWGVDPADAAERLNDVHGIFVNQVVDVAMQELGEIGYDGEMMEGLYHWLESSIDGTAKWKDAMFDHIYAGKLGGYRTLLRQFKQELLAMSER